MARKVEDAEYDKVKPRLTSLVFEPSQKRQLSEDTTAQSDAVDPEKEETETREEDEGEGGGSGSGGGAVYFDETEQEFDATELQGLSLPVLRTALKKGLKLVSRITRQSDAYLRKLLPDVSLRSRVLEVSVSDNGHPTLLLDKGEIVQYQLHQGKLERVRVTPDLEAEQAVKYAMAGFLAAGESIDPKHVKFGRSPEFAARMKPVWTQEWNRLQAKQNQLQVSGPRREVTFGNSSVAPNSVRPVRRAEPLPAMPEARRHSIEIPRPATFVPRRPVV